MVPAPVEPLVLPVLDIGPARDAQPSLPPGGIVQAWHDGDGRQVATGGRDGRAWWIDWAGLGTYWFDRDGPVRADPVAAGLEARLTDTFIRSVRPLVLVARGCEAFHASAVADDRGVTMICALSGSGKSTTALALVGAGLTHWADDMVVYHLPGEHPVVLRLPFPVRVDATARLALQERGAGAHERSVDTLLSQDRSGAVRVTDGRPLRRIYLLARDHALDPAMPSFVPVPHAARFQRLLAHGHPFEMDGDERRRRFVQAVLTVAASVDTWECRFAPSLPHLPHLARAIRAHMEAA